MDTNLGILEADDIKHNDMKERIQQGYWKRMKVLKSNLKSGNLFKAINTWGVDLHRYGAGIVEWTKEELRQVNRRTRKLISMVSGGTIPKIYGSMVLGSLLQSKPLGTVLYNSTTGKFALKHLRK